MLALYPAIEPFSHYHLTMANNVRVNKDDEITHQIYVEQCGNPLGIPVVFLWQLRWAYQLIFISLFAFLIW